MRLWDRGRCARSLAGLIVAAAVLVAAPVAYGAPAGSKPHWVQLTSPAAGILHGVSCTSPSSCVAVGFADNGVTEVGERWNGHSWKATAPVVPSGSTSALLEGVSCVSAKMCVAVGGYAEGSAYLPLAEEWNGSSWKLLSTTSVGTTSAFDGVSCPNSANCWAVGEANGKALAEHWKGSTFATVNTVSRGEFDELSGISCRSGTCIAVGGDSLGALLERSTGKGFSSISGGTTPKKTVGNLWAVSCVSAKYCVATGESDGKKGSIQTLTEIYKGKRFATVSSPDPTHLTVPYNSFYGVSCTATTSCWAAGEGGAFAFGGPNPSAKDRSTIAAHWNGKAWSVASSANPGNKPTGFLAVSCSRTTSCMAGGLREPSGAQETLIETLRG